MPDTPDAGPPVAADGSVPSRSALIEQMSTSRSMWTYRHRFAWPDGGTARVEIRSTLKGLLSQLYIGETLVVQDATPVFGPEAVRNHVLTTRLNDGRMVEITAGYFDSIRTAIAVRVDGALIHESHPGRTITYPEKYRDKVVGMSSDALTENMAAQGHDFGALKRNRLPLAVDIGTGLMFYVVGKLTNLTTAALTGAVVGILLWMIQRRTGRDLLGGLATFGIIMMLISAGLALAFQDDDAVKWRSTLMGLLGAALFLGDALILKGRRLGQGAARYMPYSDIVPQRLSFMMGTIGVIMATANVVATRVLTTDQWLFYTTFVDFILVMVLASIGIQWARRRGQPA